MLILNNVLKSLERYLDLYELKPVITKTSTGLFRVKVFRNKPFDIVSKETFSMQKGHNVPDISFVITIAPSTMRFIMSLIFALSLP